MVRHRSQYSDRQEEQGPDDENRPEQEDAKGGGVSAQSPQAKRARFLRSEKCRHGDRRNNRQIAAEEHHQAGCDIPRDGGRRWDSDCLPNRRPPANPSKAEPLLAEAEENL